MAIDRLGYVSRDKLIGNRVGVGSRADMAPSYPHVFDVRSNRDLAVRYARTAVATTVFDLAVAFLSSSPETGPAG